MGRTAQQTRRSWLASASRLSLMFAGMAASVDRAMADKLPLAMGDIGSAMVLGTDHNSIFGSLVVGITAFSAVMVILHVRARKAWMDRDGNQNARISELEFLNERQAMFLATDPQVFINWDGRNGEAVIEGEPHILGDAITIRNVTRFSDWLNPVEVSSLRTAVERLRANGEAFALQLNAISGALIEIDGRPVAGQAIMRLRAVTGERLEKSRLEEQLARYSGLLATMREMFDSMPQPVWLRTATGQISWVNKTYAASVEAKDTQDVIDRSLELLERETLDRITRAHKSGETFRGKVQAVVAGRRRVLDVVEARSENGMSGGIAIDISELETARHDFEQQNAAHVRTLDQLQTAVVLFGPDQRMTFHNRAFNVLWQLDRSFLDGRPTDSELLDRLRADGKLPEHSDFREWKLGLQHSFNANETLEDVWLLPNGRSLRIVVSPSTAGGVTYLFDDITEQMHLAQNYNRLASMQGETLDSLAEGVAVFGSNGKLQLHNPAFAAHWNIAQDDLSRAPHIDDVARLGPVETQSVWHKVRAIVCGLPDERVTRTFEVRTSAGRILSLAVTPLPDGASLLTVEDITSVVNEARALAERNEALSQASQFKSEYLHNISFELRLPLTSVVGIAQALAAGTFGSLNDLQRSYAQDLKHATDAVLMLIDDIIDMTNIDASGIEIAADASVQLIPAVTEATARLKERLEGAGVSLKLDLAPDVGTIKGYEPRVRQIVSNLVTNAIAFADRGDVITLTAQREGERISLSISDRGSVASERPSDRLSAGSSGTTGQGQSLRLAMLRTLVEAHGGTLLVTAQDDVFRQVRCLLPIGQVEQAAAPESIHG